MVEAALAAVEVADAELNAFVAVDPDRALRQAARSTTWPVAARRSVRWRAYRSAVKDTEDTIGYRTTYGSLLWRDAPTADRRLGAGRRGCGRPAA